MRWPRIPKKKLHENPKSYSPLADTASGPRFIDPETIRVGTLNHNFFSAHPIFEPYPLSTLVDQQIFTFVILPRWVPLAVLGNTIELSSSKGWRDEEE